MEVEGGEVEGVNGERRGGRGCGEVGRGGRPRAERERLILVASCAGTRPVTVAVTVRVTVMVTVTVTNTARSR